MVVAKINKINNGASSCLGSVNPNNITNGCTREWLNTKFGAVNTPKKGMIEPMLMISINDTNIINKKRALN
jgi:hypothetical protein